MEFSTEKKTKIAITKRKSQKLMTLNFWGKIEQKVTKRSVYQRRKM